MKKLSKYEARLFFTYRIGELQFKSYRKGEFIKKYGNVQCFERGCIEEDTLEHVMRCQDYDIRYRQTMTHDSDYLQIKTFVQYLVELDGYRSRKFGLPIMYRRGVKSAQIMK